jgi:hypothetical protein
MESTLDRAEKIAVLELLCVFFWYLFDGFWLMEWPWATYIGSAVSISLAVAIFFYIERIPVVIIIAIVDTLWLLVNTLWAISDFTMTEWTLDLSKIFFWLGVVLFICAIIISQPGRKFKNVLLRMKIIKLLTGQSFK